ncbi:hypothetical protein VNI00_010235 [Paramarasmius palmivorus]|uniref:Uncharacterized protein n=1 Tax=Paramarasmius palmivorus TaxID=297713 RepID=A0AAW0BUS2_9AGAR
MAQYPSYMDTKSKSSFFGKDGKLIKIAEQIPGIGFLVAVWHFCNGNRDQGYRALARCTNSTTVTIGSLLGVTLGGPLGAVLGAGLGTPIGVYLEQLSKDKIKSRRIRDELGNADMRRYLIETGRNMLLSGLAAGLATLFQPGFRFAENDDANEV